MSVFHREKFLSSFKLGNCVQWFIINPYPAKLIYFNFHPLEVVSRYRDPQLKVGENYWYLNNLGINVCKSWCLYAHLIPNNRDLID